MVDTNEVDLRKIYLTGGKMAPPGVNVNTGVKGGKYYNSEDVSAESKSISRAKTQLYKKANVTTGWKKGDEGVSHLHFRPGEDKNSQTVTRRTDSDRKSNGKDNTFHHAGSFTIVPTKTGAELRYTPAGGKGKGVVLAKATGGQSGCIKRLQHEAAYFDGEPDEIDKATNKSFKPREITVAPGEKLPSKAKQDIQRAKKKIGKTLKEVKPTKKVMLGDTDVDLFDHFEKTSTPEFRKQLENLPVDKIKEMKKQIAVYRNTFNKDYKDAHMSNNSSDLVKATANLNKLNKLEAVLKEEGDRKSTSDSKGPFKSDTLNTMYKLGHPDESKDINSKISSKKVPTTDEVARTMKPSKKSKDPSTFNAWEKATHPDADSTKQNTPQKKVFKRDGSNSSKSLKLSSKSSKEIYDMFKNGDLEKYTLTKADEKRVTAAIDEQDISSKGPFKSDTLNAMHKLTHPDKPVTDKNNKLPIFKNDGSGIYTYKTKSGTYGPHSLIFRPANSDEGQTLAKSYDMDELKSKAVEYIKSNPSKKPSTFDAWKKATHPDESDESKSPLKTEQPNKKKYSIRNNKIITDDKADAYDKSNPGETEINNSPSREYPIEKTKAEARANAMKIAHSNLPIKDKIISLRKMGVFVSAKTTPGYLDSLIDSYLDVVYDKNGNPNTFGSE